MALFKGGLTISKSQTKTTTYKIGGHAEAPIPQNPVRLPFALPKQKPVAGLPASGGKKSVFISGVASGQKKKK